MSVFAPGTGGSLKATNLPKALLEAAILLDQAENNRNGANPSLTPKQNITVSVDMGTRVAAVAATIPASFSTNENGAIVVDASDYLGASYSSFTPGTGGDLTSTDRPSALVEVAQKLASAEKAVTPVDDQPNNVTITFEQETQSITISASLPVTTSTDADGSLVVDAVDYL